MAIVCKKTSLLNDKRRMGVRERKGEDEAKKNIPNLNCLNMFGMMAAVSVLVLMPFVID